MPCWITPLNVFGVKVVSRFPKRQPTIAADILLYNAENGTLLALLDGTWITTMRTGAVAALTISLLAKENARTFAFLGLGATAHATLRCLLGGGLGFENRPITLRLLRYKGQEMDFSRAFANSPNVHFEFADSLNTLFDGADVVVSAVSAFEKSIAAPCDFSTGVLIVPIHTRGFEECDTAFERIFGDDRGHLAHFRHFKEFQNFTEMSELLKKPALGRQNQNERILAYNIGIALHDVYFATQIARLLNVD